MACLPPSDEQYFIYETILSLTNISTLTIARMYLRLAHIAHGKHGASCIPCQQKEHRDRRQLAHHPCNTRLRFVLSTGPKSESDVNTNLPHDTSDIAVCRINQIIDAILFKDGRFTAGKNQFPHGSSALNVCQCFFLDLFRFSFRLCAPDDIAVVAKRTKYECFPSSSKRRKYRCSFPRGSNMLVLLGNGPKENLP